MSDALAQFGVSQEDLPNETGVPDYPEVVVGRVAHIDADFMSYQVSAEKKDELDGTRPRRTLEVMCANAERGLEHLMRMAGADSYVAHITPSGSDKGGREALAIQLPYQGNRKDRGNRPEHLDAVRGFIGEKLPAIVHLDQEADDGMTQANQAAHDNGSPNLSVIVSMDKDLRMGIGLHYDFATETVVNAEDYIGLCKLGGVQPMRGRKAIDAFGEIWLDTTKTTKTVKGYGTKFFWAQCLMGDTADNIKGLPQVHGEMCMAIKPTAAYTKLMQRYIDAATNEEAEKYNKAIGVIFKKAKACGAVMAYEIMKDVRSDKEAFKLVRALWVESGYTFTHHATGADVTPTQALLADMNLLWMRRYNRADDLVRWIKDVMK